jgi:hypothetical protein
MFVGPALAAVKTHAAAPAASQAAITPVRNAHDAFSPIELTIYSASLTALRTHTLHPFVSSYCSPTFLANRLAGSRAAQQRTSFES